SEHEDRSFRAPTLLWRRLLGVLAPARPHQPVRHGELSEFRAHDCRPLAQQRSGGEAASTRRGVECAGGISADRPLAALPKAFRSVSSIRQKLPVEGEAPALASSYPSLHHAPGGNAKGLRVMQRRAAKQASRADESISGALL